MPTVQQLFNEMPSAFNADKAGDFEATIQFDLSGEEGGEWVVTIVDGTCVATEGVVEDPTATLHMEASDYVDMVTGKLDPMTAFIQQKVRVEGDLNAVMKFQTLFDT
ncbi:MAG: SCP2 sterol-binding domain-containing protein [Candidatus Promineifilaceae bacterium]|nr:SCP2 sterol-binding domain-containing protein [Candidatus Promineifilaceae bacterium]